jgi:DNA helicase II / ATP-dependent DNA helicase PcrA
MTTTQDFKLNIYQQGLIAYMNNDSEKHAICNAVAGSGKSTTLLYVALSLHNQGIDPSDIKIVVFGKQNSLDLIAKFGSHWRESICTLHSLGYSFCSNILSEKLEVNANKYRKIAKDLEYLKPGSGAGMLLESEAIDDESQFLKLFDLARHNLGSFESDELKELATQYNLDAIHDFDVCSEVYKLLDREGKKLAETDGIIDYTDMIYLPTVAYEFWRHKWFKPCEYALIDECQDLNPCQIEMTMKLADRLLYVGDPHQSIYGFMGSNPQSYESIKQQVNPVELPLSVCYRCPVSHIELVNELFPTIPIKSATNAKEGMLTRIEEDKACHKDNDLILSRKTAPLIKYCFKLISKGIPARVKGRNIGNGLIKEIDAIYDRASFTLSYLVNEVPKFDYFFSYIEDYQQLKQLQWHGLDNCDRLCEILDDKLKAIKVIYNNLSSDEYSFAFKGLKEAVNKLFSDTEQAITLSTVHRAKGLESERVFIIQPDDMPMSWRHQQEWEYQQELNILYVALTRSKSELYLLGDASWLETIQRGI